MKPEEKNRKSREHILAYAFAEFAEQGYLGASVNTICAAGKIAKGLLYHYYADKDALYLSCVELYFQDLTSAVITGAALNILLDPVFMFDWGLNLGVEGASLATTVSQFVTFFILTWFYVSGHSVIKIRLKAFRPTWKFVKDVAIIGIPTAVIQICLSVAASLTNIATASLPQSDESIAAYGVVQRLVLIGCYMVMGFMQGYQPVASYAFGAQNEDRFHQSVRFALKGALLLTVLVEAAYILLAKPLILPKLLGVAGIYATQPAADVLTILVCVCSIPAMKRIASRNMGQQ